VRGSVAPAGLEAECESTIRAFFESVAGKRRSSHVPNQALQASAVERGYTDAGVEAHASVSGDTERGLGVCTQLVETDTVTEAPPLLALLTARCAARVQRRRGE
jgi:hypothetical protein